MALQVTAIMLGVKDLARSKKFYGEGRLPLEGRHLGLAGDLRRQQRAKLPAGL